MKRANAVVRLTSVYATLVVAAAVTLIPFVLSVLNAFKTPVQFSGETALALPDPWVFDNFVAILTGSAGFGRSLAVTALVTVFILVFQVGFSILAAYAFARMTFPGREALFWIYLGTLMVPTIALVIPLYLMMAGLGLRDTFWGLVLPFSFGSPYAIFLLREYFRSIPQDLVDAARLDGANAGDVLVELVVPLSWPMILTLILITVVSQWNSFLWPSIVTTSDTWRVVTVATSNLQTQHNGKWTLVMAATTIVVVPLAALCLVFHKRLMRSVALTGLR